MSNELEHNKDNSISCLVLVVYCVIVLGLLICTFIMAYNKDTSFKDIVPLITTSIAALLGFTALYYTLKIYPYKLALAELDKRKVDQEFENKKKEFKLIRERTNDIAIKISQALIETPDWFGRYMDEMGAAFTASIFGKRFKHFYFEKKAIAKKVIEELDDAVNGFSDFDAHEFKTPLTIKKLCSAINKDCNNLHLEAKINTLDWLNELLKVTNLCSNFSNKVYSNNIKELVRETQEYSNKKFLEINNKDGKNAIKQLNRLLLKETYPLETPWTEKYYLIIESGTTMFALFPEITRYLEDKISREMWKRHVTIITNNIPGAQYLMKNCKENPSDDDSKIAIDCFLLPGRIDSKLVATEWNTTEYPLEDLISSINNNSGQKSQNKVIGFITGHHIVRTGGKATFCPVTREGIHQEIKEKIAIASDEIYLIAPLMQFSLKDNIYLKKAYKAINNTNKKGTYDKLINLAGEKVTVFTSKRDDEYHYKFKAFSDNLHKKLSKWAKHVNIVDFKLCDHINHNYEPSELQLEIPDEDLRTLYGTDNCKLWQD